MGFLSAVGVQSWEDREESNLLILHKSNLGSHDFEELVDEGDVLAVIFDLASDIDSQGWSRFQKFGICLLEIRFAPVTEGNSLD